MLTEKQIINIQTDALMELGVLPTEAQVNAAFEEYSEKAAGQVSTWKEIQKKHFTKET